MNRQLINVFIEAIFIENTSLQFYRNLAEKVTNLEIKSVFELLATCEKEHLDRMIKYFPGEGIDLLQELNTSVNCEDYFMKHKKITIDNATEKEALELSLLEKQECIEQYSCFISSIDNQQLLEVFKQTLDETRCHFDFILHEYKRHWEGTIQLSDSTVSRS